MTLSLIVNAGGQSKRMGRAKALLAWPGTEQSLLAHIITRLASLVDDRIIVVANEPDLVARAGVEQPVQVVADIWPEAGALGGIASGLTQVTGWALCVACDMPFVQVGVVAKLVEAMHTWRDDVDAIIPQATGHLQPFHALYHPRLLGHLETQIAAGHLRIADALAGARLHIVDQAETVAVDPTLRTFWNVNTPQDWAQAIIWWKEEQAME